MYCQHRKNGRKNASIVDSVLRKTFSKIVDVPSTWVKSERYNRQHRQQQLSIVDRQYTIVIGEEGERER